MPQYTELLKLSTNKVNINIKNQNWQLLSTAEKLICDELQVDDYQGFKYSIEWQNKKPYALISISTIRKNHAGELEKLIAFDIEINKNAADAAPAKNSTPSSLFKGESVLRSGRWVKVNVSISGIYKITYSELEAWGLNNANISVWGNGGRALPYMNNQPCPDDLIPVPVQVVTGNDGVFNQGDYILFYAEGAETYEFLPEQEMWTKTQHPYSHHISYFLTIDQEPTPITTSPTPETPANQHTSAYDAVVVFEYNAINLVRSGRKWFGDLFDVNTTHEYHTKLQNPVHGSTMRVFVQMAAKSTQQTNFTISANSNTIGTLTMGRIDGSSHSNVASIANTLITSTIPNNELTLKITYNKANTTDQGWLDFLAVNARQHLIFDGSQLTFWDSQSCGTGNITEFTLSNATSDTKIWDITQHNATMIIPTTGSGTIRFTQNTDTLRRFIAFSPDNALTVEFDQEVENQNLHAMGQPELVIVTHPDFLAQAQELAQIHRQNDHMSVEVVTTTMVYNEFSSGTSDVSAIRNLMRMLYQRAQTYDEQPKYLLLFGDGSYDNRSLAKNNTNRIPTYQSENSINPVISYVTDDFFGLLDPDEGGEKGLLDIGVGRLPANSIDEAQTLLEKIKIYTSNQNIADWQNILCFVGDDGDNNTHMNDANQLADYVVENHPEFNVQKIFFDAYPLAVLPTGHRYPDVTNAINSRMNNGALLLNYTGHANERWLAYEKVVMSNDILAWQNLRALPLFVTATCEYSRFDDPNLVSAGELVLLSPKGGAIALLSTTRVVYSSPNFILNFNFIKNVFEKDTVTGNYRTLGELIKLSKNLSGSGNNKLNFTLLGDPALRLRYPSYGMNLTAIDGNTVDNLPDTLKSLDRVTLSGNVVDNHGNTDNNFNGTATIALYDKATLITTLGNNGNTPIQFKSQENILFRGTTPVENGHFNVEFILPKDINFAFGKGKISMFASNNQCSASGQYSNLLVGGINNNVEPDNQGPEIELYLNDLQFKNGGICGPNPKLLVKLRDPSGINTTGIGIGHDFTATISNQLGNKQVINLNAYYNSTGGHFDQGEAKYQLANLDLGLHKISVKAWDTYNNSTVAELKFRVTNDNQFEAQNLMCAPNPISDWGTAFYFEHNQPDVTFDIDLKIFGLTGNLVKHIELHDTNSGNYRYGPLPWDGKTQQGNNLSPGMYIARMQITTQNGQKRTLQQKILVIR